MKTFTIYFIGRKIYAIGIRYQIKETVQAPDIESAKLKLYEKYEHISILDIKEVA